MTAGNMKSLIVASICLVLAALPLSQGGPDEDQAALQQLFTNPVPKSSLFTTVGYECTINSVAFPNMYLYMKHYRIFFDDHLKLKAGSPRKDEAEWDWRGIWTIQKLVNSTRSNVTDYVLQDHENKEYATFSPTSSQVFVPIGASKLVQGALWNLDFRAGPQGSVTTIQNAVPVSASINLHKFYLTAVTGDDGNATRAVELDYKFQEDRSRWKVVCNTR